MQALESMISTFLMISTESRVVSLAAVCKQGLSDIVSLYGYTSFAVILFRKRRMFAKSFIAVISITWHLSRKGSRIKICGCIKM